MSQTSANIVLDNSPAVRCVKYPFNSGLDFKRKCRAKTGMSVLVKCRRLAVFEARAGWKS
jgi:hypothetical protein